MPLCRLYLNVSVNLGSTFAKTKTKPKPKPPLWIIKPKCELLGNKENLCTLINMDTDRDLDCFVRMNYALLQQLEKHLGWGRVFFPKVNVILWRIKNKRIILAAKNTLNKGKFQGREIPYLSVTGSSSLDLKLQTSWNIAVTDMWNSCQRKEFLR